MEGSKLWVVHYTKTYAYGESTSFVFGIYSTEEKAREGSFWVRSKSMNTCEPTISEVIVE